MNGFSWSLTHSLEPKKKKEEKKKTIRFWPALSHCGQRVSLPAGQATSHSVSLPALTFQWGRPASQKANRSVNTVRQLAKNAVKDWTTQTVILLFGWIMAMGTSRKFTQPARCQSLQSVCKQGSLSFIWLIMLLVTLPHSEVMRGKCFLLIFIQPLIDPLLIRSLCQGECLFCQAVDKKATQASGRCGRSSSQAASPKCGKRQPRWPSQVAKRQKMCSWIMAWISPLYCVSLSQEKSLTAKWQALLSMGQLISQLFTQSVNKPVTQLAGQSFCQSMTQSTRHAQPQKLSPLNVVKDVPGDSEHSSRNENVSLFLLYLPLQFPLQPQWEVC